MVQCYLLEQKDMFKGMDIKILGLQERGKLIACWKNFKGKEFHEKYQKRCQQLLTYK